MTQLQQTPIIAGQPSTVTLVMADASGNPIERSFQVPPGKTPALPSNLATDEDVAQMVAGAYLIGRQDLRGAGLKWDGQIGAPVFFYGSTGGPSPALYSHLLGSNQTGNYLFANGNSAAQVVGETGPLMIQRFSTTAANPTTITFPTAFAGDNVSTLIFPHYQGAGSAMGGHIINILTPANRYSVSVSVWNYTSSAWENNQVPVDVVAIGPAPATV